jgi:L-lysine exporter family protein LysE/ArgO
MVLPKGGGMVGAYLSGLGVGFGLIVAIGAQNAYVLTRGVRGDHAWAVAGVCSLCDLVLIATGVLGLGAAVASHPVLAVAAGWGGAAFLSWYGLSALRSALRPQGLAAQDDGDLSRNAAVAVALTVSLLNPHVYLDTVVLLGSTSGTFPGAQRWLFGLGAGTASVLWFFGLALGGRALAPLFARPAAWRLLDGVVCLTLWGVALSLARSAWAGGF